MFAGFGILSGGAHVAGQGDRSSFQLASAAKVFYGPKPYRATLEAFGRKQRWQTDQLGRKSETESPLGNEC